MKISFISWEKESHQLCFSMIGGEEKLYLVRNQLLIRLCNNGMGLSDKKNSNLVITDCDLQCFLRETKKIFIDAGVSTDDWQAFERQIEVAANIKASKGRDFHALFLNQQHDILQYCIEPYLGIKDKLAAVRVCTDFNRFFNNPRDLFRKYFPDVDDLPQTHEGFEIAIAIRYQCLNPRQRRLMQCCKAGDTEVLLALKPSLEEIWKTEDTQSRSALYWASRNKRQALLNVVYEQIVLPFFKVNDVQIDTTKRSCRNSSILHWAVRCNQGIDTLIALINQDRKLLILETDEGWSGLHCGAETGHLSALKYMSEQVGIDINKADQTGATPLYKAAYENNLSAVQFLCKRPGIEVNKAKKNGVTPLFIAVYEGYLPLVEFLCEHPGIEINMAMDGGATPLYIAAYYGHLPIVQLLCEHPDIEINKAKRDGGTTPLFIAAKGNHLPVVQFLCERPDIEINKASQFDGTPLYIAAVFGHLPVIKFFCSRPEININATWQGKTALQISIEESKNDGDLVIAKHPDAVTYFIHHPFEASHFLSSCWHSYMLTIMMIHLCHALSAPSQASLILRLRILRSF